MLSLSFLKVFFDSPMKSELETEDLQKIADMVVEKLNPLLNNSQNSNDDELMTVESLAKYLSVSKQWVYERVTLNEIPFIKMRKFPRFRKSVIDNWLDKMKTPAIQPLSNGLSNKLKMIKLGL